ncbi:DUF1636 domain-containing protein [Paracoccaceae bacterium]|nr:DUF1636 domain-containing protein [Paracoccaceae bacterium]
MDDSQPILSICTSCRDGREAEYSDVRGGTRLAKSILIKMQSRFDISFDLHGIACMSQCKRPYIATICATGRFSYMFGDLDPENPTSIDALLDFPSLYLKAPEGFLELNERPKPLQKSIFARIPSLISSTAIVIPLNM